MVIREVAWGAEWRRKRAEFRALDSRRGDRSRDGVGLLEVEGRARVECVLGGKMEGHRGRVPGGRQGRRVVWQADVFEYSPSRLGGGEEISRRENGPAAAPVLVMAA